MQQSIEIRQGRSRIMLFYLIESTYILTLECSSGLVLRLRFAPLIWLSDACVPNTLDQHRRVGLKLSRLCYSFGLRSRDDTRPFRGSSTNRKVTLRPTLDE